MHKFTLSLIPETGSGSHALSSRLFTAALRYIRVWWRLFASRWFRISRSDDVHTNRVCTFHEHDHGPLTANDWLHLNEWSRAPLAGHINPILINYIIWALIHLCNPPVHNPKSRSSNLIRYPMLMILRWFRARVITPSPPPQISRRVILAKSVQLGVYLGRWCKWRQPNEKTERTDTNSSRDDRILNSFMNFFPTDLRP